MWEIRNPVHLYSLLLTKKHSGKGSANSKVKNRSCKQRTNCMTGEGSPHVWGSDWLGRRVDAVRSKMRVG